MNPLDKIAYKLRKVTHKLQKSLKKGGYLSTTRKSHKKTQKKHRKNARKSRSIMTALLPSVLNK